MKLSIFVKKTKAEQNKTWSTEACTWVNIRGNKESVPPMRLPRCRTVMLSTLQELSLFEVRLVFDVNCEICLSWRWMDGIKKRKTESINLTESKSGTTTTTFHRSSTLSPTLFQNTISECVVYTWHHHIHTPRKRKAHKKPETERRYRRLRYLYS